MAETAHKLPVTSEPVGTGVKRAPFTTFRREIDRLFDEFDAWSMRGPLRNSLFNLPFGSTEASVYAPAVDISEKKDAFEITAEIPGMEEKDIEVKLANGGLFIRGEKKSDREEKEKNYYLSERNYGSFERYFALPEGVDAEKISASFKNGVLLITLPKTPETQKKEKKIPVKAQ